MVVTDAPSILVFGQSGQVAQELARLDGFGGCKLTFAGRETCDLLVDDACAFIHAAKPQAVINASAYTAVDRAETEPNLAFRLNGDAVREMATACADTGTPFIHMSTDYVFDGSKTSPYSEADDRRPLSVYGSSKLAGEQAVEAAGGRWTILRTAWVFSPFGANFVKTMLRLAAERTEISVVADQWGRPTLAADIARMALRAATSHLEGDVALKGVFHLAGADDAVWADVADYVFIRSAEVSGKRLSLRRISTSDYPTPAQRPANSRLDCSRLQAAIAWSPRPWRDAVDECLKTLLPKSGNTSS